MQLSWGIYQTRIVREQERLMKIIGKKDAAWKVYSLIAEPRNIIKNNDRARAFP